MALQHSSFWLLAVALSIAALPARAEVSEHDTAPAIVLKLRDGVADADPKPLLARLATALPGGAGWRPERVRPLFTAPSEETAPGRWLPPQLRRVYVSDLPPGVRVDQAIAVLAKDPRVEYVQPDHVREAHAFTPSDAYYYSSGAWGQPYGDLWALRKINLEHGWNFSRGADIVVAVVDSGIDHTHPELLSRMWMNPEELGQAGDNGYPGDVRGWDFVSNDNDPQDEFGHGTHLAGIIAASANDGGIVGVAPEARLMAVRAIKPGGTGNSSTVAAGIVYAADNGARVITLSSGCVARCPSDPVVESAVRHATARGAILVVSAGNRGDDLALHSPQNMVDPRPIVVGSSDEVDGAASFSNSGDWLDLVAPGGGSRPAPGVVQPVANILSLAASSCSPQLCTAPRRVGDGYLRLSGTSMSAAYVSGVIALILDANPLANLDVVRAKLFGDADDLGPAGHDRTFGWGRLTGLNTVADLRRYILARILSPSNGQAVSGLVRIVGAADARTFSSYDVSVGAGASPVSWQTDGRTLMGRATPQGDLAEWNTQGLAPGTWTIRLVVHDTLGGQREQRRTVTVQAGPQLPLLVLDVASEHGGSGSVQAGPSGAVCQGQPWMTETCSYPTTAGATVTLTPVPGDLSGFTGWSGACSGLAVCTVQVTALQGVRATFQGPAKLTVRVDQRGYGEESIFVDPPGTPCEESCTYLYPPGPTIVNLSSGQPGPLNTVSIYGETCEGGSQCTLVMDRDRSVIAEVTSIDVTQTILAYAPRDQRAPFGTPVTLQGFAYAPFEPLAVLSYQWQDLITGEVLGETAALTVTLSFGYHELRFTAYRYNADGFYESAYDDVQVTVHDP